MSATAPTRHARRPLRRACALSALSALLAALSFAGLAQAQVTTTGDYLQRMDTDGDGRVGVEEYVQWMLYAFDRMDRNGDGVLSVEELPGGRGKPITREQQRQTLVERFHKQDANGDGFLSAKELMAPPR
ncbi:MAG: EF-hand domain-containing protein [Stenotrophomonas sp.]